MINFYNVENIQELAWPNTPNGLYEKKFLSPLITLGPHAFIENIDLEMGAVKIDNFVLSIAITQGETKNSWVCSPYAHYIDYGKQEINQFQNKVLKYLLNPIVDFFGKVALKGKINDIVYVNNWLFATDIYPSELKKEHVSLLLEYLKSRFPSHAIVFRSLNPLLNCALQEELKKQGSYPIASRFVYIFDAKDSSFFESRILKSDLKLWKSHPYRVEMKDHLESDEEVRHLLSLYHSLYIHNHSKINPQYNFRYFQQLNESLCLSYIMLWDKEEIKGAAGYFIKDNVLYCPIFGYDKSRQDHTKIYRILNTGLLVAAKQRGCTFHMSAGASFYKKIRGAKGCLESNLVYYHHLPLKQRLSWSLIRTFMNGVGSYFMKRY